MQQIVTAKTATIREATVEIKTLMVSGRQLTLATFRQIPTLPNEPLEPPSFLAWGWVNYVFRDCLPKWWWNHNCHGEPERQYVIQIDDSLFRYPYPRRLTIPGENSESRRCRQHRVDYLHLSASCPDCIKTEHEWLEWIEDLKECALILAEWEAVLRDAPQLYIAT